MLVNKSLRSSKEPQHDRNKTKHNKACAYFMGNTSIQRPSNATHCLLWASCQLRKIAGCACAENAGNVFPPPWVSDPDRHHGTCVMRMPGSLTSGFILSRWRGKCSRHYRRMRNPQYYVSGKRPMLGHRSNCNIAC